MALSIIKLRTLLASVLDRQDDRGASLVEYALLLAFIAIICVVAVTTLGESTSEGLDSVSPGFTN